MRTITFRGRQLWPRPPRPPARHGAPDTRSLLQRWQDGPEPAPLRRDIGSMDMDAEHAWRLRGRAAFAEPCDDTGEHASTRVWSAVAGVPQVYGTLGAVPHFCPRCEAPDDGPHYEGCPFYDPDEAALFAADVNAVLAPVEARARALDPDAWRPYLTAAEFAETFPGVPYAVDLGPTPADLAGLAQLAPSHAEEVLALIADTREYLAQRGAAFALDRGRILAAWRTLGA